MQTTRLSSKGQVIIPKAFRSSLKWETGIELVVTDTGDGLLLKPKAPFAAAELATVAGIFKGKVKPRSDAEIETALNAGMRRAWRDGN